MCFNKQPITYDGIIDLYKQNIQDLMSDSYDWTDDESFGLNQGNYKDLVEHLKDIYDWLEAAKEQIGRKIVKKTDDYEITMIDEKGIHNTSFKNIVRFTKDSLNIEKDFLKATDLPEEEREVEVKQIETNGKYILGILEQNENYVVFEVENPDNYKLFKTLKEAKKYYEKVSQKL